MVTGGVFKSDDPAPDLINAATDAMVATGVTYYLLPNHPFTSSKSAPNIHTLSESCPIKPGFEIVTQAALGNPKANGTLRILAAQGRGQGFVNHLITHIRTGAAHYLAVGGNPSTTTINEDRRAWYAGTPEPTSWDQPQAGNVLLVDLDESKLNVKLEPINTWKILRKKWPIATDDDVTQVHHWVGQLPNKPNTVLFLGLHGAVSIAQYALLADLWERYKEAFALFSPWTKEVMGPKRPPTKASQ